MFARFGRSSPLKPVLDVLEMERACLLSGDLTGLTDLVSKREKLIDGLDSEALEKAGIGAEDLAQVERRIRRNAALMRAAITGMKAADARLREIEAAHAHLKTYSSDGSAQDLAQNEPRLAKKA